MTEENKQESVVCCNCGEVWDRQNDDPQRRNAIICLKCDLKYWDIEQAEFNEMQS